MPLIQLSDYQLHFLTELFSQNQHLVSGDEELEALHQVLNPQTPNPQTLDSQMLDSETVNSQTVNSQTVNSQTVNSQTVDSEMFNNNAQMLDSETLNSKTLNFEMLNSKMLDFKTRAAHRPYYGYGRRNYGSYGWLSSVNGSGRFIVKLKWVGYS